VAAPKEAQERETGRIVRFPTRNSSAKGKARKGTGNAEWHDAGVADLRKYERSAEPDDYRRRMIINVAAFTFIVALTLTGIWLADQLALLRKHQDCALSGRKHCAEIDWHAPGR
jgi:hypothetical protein